MDEFETWWESPSGAYDRQHKFLAKAAWEAGREAGMREAAAIVHSREAAKEIAMQVRPYEPISAENVALLMEDCHDACVAIHLTILAAIEAKP